MSDKMLRRKIGDTRLFSDEEKILLLVHIDDLSVTDCEKLATVIDSYDQKYQKISADLKSEIHEALEALKQRRDDSEKTQEAVDFIQSGLSLLA